MVVIIVWSSFVALNVHSLQCVIPRSGVGRMAGVSHRMRQVTARFQFKNFDDMMDKLEVPVLVDFYAQWCGPCVMMQPILEDVAQRLEGEARVAKVDTDKSPRLGSRYQVEALPTLILFYKGDILEKFIGYRTADELETAVRKAMKRIPK